MWFKEKQGATVDVVNVGGPETEPTLRKALAIGADTAIRVNTPAKDGFQVAKQLAKVAGEGVMTLSLPAGNLLTIMAEWYRECLPALLKANFVNTCISLEVEGNEAKAVREIDGGKESVTTSLPLVVGAQKGLVEESDLRFLICEGSCRPVKNL
jgi:electron transfer flavoprotein beta subunit